jgi:hypothetical protein
MGVKTLLLGGLLLLAGCGGASEPTTPPLSAATPPGATATATQSVANTGDSSGTESPPEQPATENPLVKNGVNYACRTDQDCAVKDIGNCCGHYPACVNADSPTFPEQVKAQCASEGQMAVCGFPEISGCTCVEGRCTDVTGVASGAELR